MRTRQDITQDTVVSHFTARAYKYDDSSKWCTGGDMLQTIVRRLAPDATATVLDIACGTGLISRQFHGKVKHLTCVDITDAMFHKAKGLTDALIKASAECLPLLSTACCSASLSARSRVRLSTTCRRPPNEKTSV